MQQDRPTQGRPFAPSASQWNEHTWAAEQVRAWQQRSGFSPESVSRSQTCVLAYNDGSDDLDQYDACDPSSVYLDRADNEEEFCQATSYYAHAFRFVDLPAYAPYHSIPLALGICQEPIPRGAWGKVAVAGLSICKLDESTSYGSGFVHANEAAAGPLLIEDCWGARLVYRDKTASPYYGIVRIDDIQNLRPIELKTAFGYPYGSANQKVTAEFYPLDLSSGSTPTAITDYSKTVTAYGPPCAVGWGRDATAGVAGARGWAMATTPGPDEEWTLVSLQEVVHQARVQSSHANFDSYGTPATTVLVKRYANGSEFGDAFRVWLQIPAGQAPALFDGDIVGIGPSSDPTLTGASAQIPLIVVTPCSDDVLGTIKFFGGAAGSVPAGWTICDGSEGTLDLIDQFIKGKATAGGTGGASTHTHDAHDNPILNQINPHWEEVGSGSGYYWGTWDGEHSAANHEPPWYGLIPIQRTH